MEDDNSFSLLAKNLKKQSFEIQSLNQTNSNEFQQKWPFFWPTMEDHSSFSLLAKNLKKEVLERDP